MQADDAEAAGASDTDATDAGPAEATETQTDAAGEQEQTEPADDAAQTDAAGDEAQETQAGEGEAAAQGQPSEQEIQTAVQRAPEISQEQTVEIKQVFTEGDFDVERVDIDIDIDIGVWLGPDRVVYHPLPPAIIEIVPAYAGYLYFITTAGVIVIVDPTYYVVVYVIYV